MDENAPHVLGSTRKLEAEFRAKREAETVAVQRRRSKTKAKTLPPVPEDGSETIFEKTGARGNVATTGPSRNKKGTARIIKKGKAKATEESDTEEETGEASNAAEDLDIDETPHADEALKAGTTHNNFHKVRSSLVLFTRTSY